MTEMSAPTRGLSTWLRELGTLRVVLAAMALLLIVFATRAGTPPVFGGFALLPTVLMPVLAPMVLMVLMLDALMARVFMFEKEAAERARYRRIVGVDLVLSVVLVLAWLPYFRALTG
jgi:uncharacterized membrane protein